MKVPIYSRKWIAVNSQALLSNILKLRPSNMGRSSVKMNGLFARADQKWSIELSFTAYAIKLTTCAKRLVIICNF